VEEVYQQLGSAIMVRGKQSLVIHRISVEFSTREFCWVIPQKSLLKGSEKGAESKQKVSRIPEF